MHPFLQCTNHVHRIQCTSKFLCKRVSSMISSASFKRAQKIKKNLSFTHLFQQSFPDSSTIIPYTLITTDTADSVISAPLLISPSNCTPVNFLTSVPASALPYDSIQRSSYTFMLRTILDGRIRSAQNIRSNHLYSIRRGNCYFLLNPTPDLNNCYMIHTNSPLLLTVDPFQFILD
ncbi:unnamed protein product [Rhizophagus irregularis]|nr:unnamed protein product [Rhizophagus irregularis]CAB5374148.1 unnamed protein product [Rhizophagus irregularis]